MTIDWIPAYLDTFIPELPRIMNKNMEAVQTYLDVFYDGSSGIIIAPVNTTGSVKGGQAEFVTGIFDNLVVKSQFVNRLENTTTVDGDFYNEYIGTDVSTRDASTQGTLIENALFSYVDLNQPYQMITNDASYAFQTNQLGQEFQLIWDPSSLDGGPFTVLLNPNKDTSIGGTAVETISVNVADSSTTWLKLIVVDYDASYGPTFTLKQWAGTFSKQEF